MLRELFREAVGIPTARIARPRLVIEAVVSNGVVKAVRCKAEVDADVEAVFTGVLGEPADVLAGLHVEKIRPAERQAPLQRRR